MPLTYNNFDFSEDGKMDDGSKSDAVIYGIPFDHGATGPSGQRAATETVRMAAYWDDLPDHTSKVVDVGDAIVYGIAYEETRSEAIGDLKQFAKNTKRIITIGGDNLVSEWCITAMFEHYKKPINLVVFDAHWDYDDHTYPDHGTWLRSVVEDNKVHQVHHHGQRALEGRPPVFGMVDFLYRRTPNSGLVPDDFSDRLRPTYIVIDVDILDPSVLSGTGIRVPGGWSAGELFSVLNSYLTRCNVVGMDITEVCPPMDDHGVASLTASYLVMQGLLKSTFD